MLYYNNKGFYTATFYFMFLADDHKERHSSFEDREIVQYGNVNYYYTNRLFVQSKIMFLLSGILKNNIDIYQQL